MKRFPLFLVAIIAMCLMVVACSGEDLARAHKLAEEAQTRAAQAEQALTKAQGLVTVLQATIDAMRPAAEKGDVTAADLMAKAQAQLDKAKNALPEIAAAASQTAKLAQDAQGTLAELEKQAKDNGGNIPWYVAVGTFAIHYAPAILARIGVGALPGGGIVTSLASLVASFNWSAQATAAQRKEDEEAAASHAAIKQAGVVIGKT